MFVWNGLLSVLLNQKVSAKLSGTEGDFGRLGTVVVFALSIINWSFDLFG